MENIEKGKRVVREYDIHKLDKVRILIIHLPSWKD